MRRLSQICEDNYDSETTKSWLIYKDGLERKCVSAEIFLLLILDSVSKISHADEGEEGESDDINIVVHPWEMLKKRLMYNDTFKHYITMILERKRKA